MFQSVGVFKCQSPVIQPPLAITELLTSSEQKGFWRKSNRAKFLCVGFCLPCSFTELRESWWEAEHTAKGSVSWRISWLCKAACVANHSYSSLNGRVEPPDIFHSSLGLTGLKPVILLSINSCNEDSFQQLCVYLHEHTSPAVILLAVLQETTEHSNRNITATAHHGIQLSGSDSPLMQFV